MAVEKPYSNRGLSEVNALQSFIGYAQSQERLIKKSTSRDLGTESERAKRKKGKLQTFQTSLVERDGAELGLEQTEREGHILDKAIHPLQSKMMEIRCLAPLTEHYLT